MKRIIILCLTLTLIFSTFGCKVKTNNEAVFDTVDVSSVTFYSPSHPDGLVVPDEDLPVILNWLGTFTVGKKAGDSLTPGANSFSVQITYSNGEKFKNGLTTIKIEESLYYMDSEEAPTVYLELVND